MNFPSPIIRWCFLVLAAWLAAATVRNIAFPEFEAGFLFNRFVHDGVLVVAGALCVLRAVREAHERVAWALIGAGVLSWTFGEVYYTVVLWTVTDVPVPSPADAGFLLMPPFMLAGLVLLLRSRTTGVPATLRTDGVTAALAIGALNAAIVFDTAMESASGDPLGMATWLAYPLSDLVLAGFVAGALASTGWRADRTWTMLGAGFLAFWFADSLYLVQVAHETYESGGWFDAGWWVGLTLISAAAWTEDDRSHAAAARLEGMRLIVMPLCFGSIGLGLLVYGCFRELNPLATVLASAAILAVMGRLILTFRENMRMLRASQGEALTDDLTGLPNRRALARDLERDLEHADEDHPLVLVLFDLDGFKLYNDTFGHPAGDTLLARLGARLDEFLDGRGTPYRMGGDEFCALFSPEDGDPAEIIAGSVAALSEHGEGFHVGCSYGSILLPAEAADAAEALRIADQRMYEQKHGGRASAARQSVDVLLRTVAECDAELSSHVEGVAGLAEQVARHLGLTDEQVASVRHAAALHDIGKVAVPDAILDKPGPLDDREWDFIRRHTLIGERIIGAAPALKPVARMVRSSHEHWDGTGYPDALRGEDIPLGARIVSVADAYDAMVTDRPYRAARPAHEALEELRAAAGTQFDPAVVEAFCAVCLAPEAAPDAAPASAALLAPAS